MFSVFDRVGALFGRTVGMSARSASSTGDGCGLVGRSQRGSAPPEEGVKELHESARGEYTRGERY